METIAYKRAAVGKRRAERTAEDKKRENRRLIQLLVSLGLFLVVFIGRGVFPAQTEQWSDLITADIDFSAVFQDLRENISADESVWTAIGKLAVSMFGGEVPEVQSTDSVDDIQAEQDAVEMMLLSETPGHGLVHMGEHGLRKYKIESNHNQAVSTEPEIVTAVAQPYNADGEALPTNVSYEYYELGLNETVVPVVGTVTSGFEYRTSPISGKREFHLALDIAAAEGTEIAAFADGVVRYIGESDDFGLYLMIDHDNGVATFYAHCSRLLVRKGDVVSCGQTIALVGHTGNATGSHLHFTIEKDDIRLDPAYYVNPE